MDLHLPLTSREIPIKNDEVNMPKYRIISADTHIVEPPDLWTSRLGARFGDRVPRVVVEETMDRWYCDGLMIADFYGGGSQAGVRFTEPEKLTRELRQESVLPGAYIPNERVKDMDADGVEAEVIFPTVGLRLYRVPDSELVTAICGTYNDWIGEFCESFPDRMKGVAMLNLDKVSDGVRELERCAKMGLAGAWIPVYPPQGREYHLPEYEPLWAAAQDLGMPLSFHGGCYRYRAGPGQNFEHKSTESPSFRVNDDYWPRMSVSDMIFGGVFERFPKLQVGLVEVGELAWAPHFLTRIDYFYTQREWPKTWYRFKEHTLPSDFFYRNVFITFQEDAVGLRLRDVIGVDNLLWGSDYPHAESTFPRSQQILEEILADCTQEERAKIIGGNASRIYRFD